MTHFELTFGHLSERELMESHAVYSWLVGNAANYYAPEWLLVHWRINIRPNITDGHELKKCRQPWRKLKQVRW